MIVVSSDLSGAKATCYWRDRWWRTAALTDRRGALAAAAAELDKAAQRYRIGALRRG
ncbi:MAG TPA: hypothetical protein VNL71_21080 [Chloroflexota bacterium]|nr:hypothetical protein [Chloroflexota bacterium]